MIAERVGPQGRVVGADLDPITLDLARQEAIRRGLPWVDFRELTIGEWSEPDTYDLVHCRNVLQHLSQPVEVLRTMWDAVRAGGVIAVEDADFEGSFCDPHNAGFDFWVRAYQLALRANGGDPLSGRKLHRHFTAAGIPAPDVTVVQRRRCGRGEVAAGVHHRAHGRGDHRPRHRHRRADRRGSRATRCPRGGPRLDHRQPEDLPGLGPPHLTCRQRLSLTSAAGSGDSAR